MPISCRSIPNATPEVLNACLNVSDHRQSRQGCRDGEILRIYAKKCPSTAATTMVTPPDPAASKGGACRHDRLWRKSGKRWRLSGWRQKAENGSRRNPLRFAGKCSCRSLQRCRRGHLEKKRMRPGLYTASRADADRIFAALEITFEVRAPLALQEIDEQGHSRSCLRRWQYRAAEDLPAGNRRALPAICDQANPARFIGSLSLRG